MTNWKHAARGETCTKCNDYAARIVGTEALCVDHFESVIGPIARKLERQEVDEPPDDAEVLRVPVVQRADAVDLTPPRLLIRGWLPYGVVTLIGGKPGIGKGVVIADLIARGSRLRQMPNGDALVRAFSTTIVCFPGEDDVNEWVRRLVVAGANMSRVHLTDHATHDESVWSVSFIDLPAIFADAANRGDSLLVLDSLAGLAASVGVDTNKSEIRNYIEQVGALAKKYDVAVLLVHHVRKGGGDPLEMLQGNTQIVASCRSVLAIVPEQTDDDTTSGVAIIGVPKLNGSRKSDPVAYSVRGEQLLGPDGVVMRDDRGDAVYTPVVEWAARPVSSDEYEHASHRRSSKRAETDAAELLASDPMLSTTYFAAMEGLGHSEDQAKRARKACGGAVKVGSVWWSHGDHLSTAEAKAHVEEEGE